MTARLVRIALLLAFATAPALARAADPTLSTEDHKTVYALGYSSAKGLERLALKPDELEIFLAAIRDGMSGKAAPIDIETYATKVQAFAEGRNAEASQGEKTASAEFQAKEAAAPGATKLPSGLIKRVVKEGNGAAPAATDTVKVHYHGTLRDGSVFDSSVERGEPAEFPLNRVIPCWTEAVQTMKTGEKAHITCPADIAYGDRGFPPKIKGGATLAFDVELIEIVKK